MKKFNFRLSDYLIMAMLAAMGIAVKVIIVPLVHLVTGPLFIPGGVLAGGFYMMFLVLGIAIIGKNGPAFIISLIQAALVTITGTFGSHGAVSLLTYTLPGLGVELWFFLTRHKACCAPCCFVAGIIANLSGSLAVNLALFNLPPIPLILALSLAALSGGLGGLAANFVAQNLKNLIEIAKGESQ